MKQRTRRVLRGGASLALALTALWAVAAAAPAASFGEAVRALDGDALALIRFERGDFLTDDVLSLPAAFALRVSPLLLSARREIAAAWADEPPPAAASTVEPERSVEPSPAGAEPAPIAVRDNGVPSTTLRPSDPSGYLVYQNVYVHNTSAAALSQGDLGFDFSAAFSDAAPQVLIVHTHGCEAYTPPPGEEYVESDDHRTLDEANNVLRVGDEIARVLEAAGVGVLHDRTLHDYPSYSGSYERSLATVERCRAEYPSLVYILDVHRDAVADETGRQYKLLCAEAPDAAQLEFVVGSDGGGLEHPRWRENLKLACAVQSALLDDYPTLMRPIVVRNSRYNQQASVGALLLEVGTAGNSLEEALNAARLFAKGFAETIEG